MVRGTVWRRGANADVADGKRVPIRITEVGDGLVQHDAPMPPRRDGNAADDVLSRVGVDDASEGLKRLVCDAERGLHHVVIAMESEHHSNALIGRDAIRRARRSGILGNPVVERWLTQVGPPVGVWARRG